MLHKMKPLTADPPLSYYFYFVELVDASACACDQNRIAPAIPKVTGNRARLYGRKAMPTAGITGANAIGQSKVKSGSRLFFAVEFFVSMN